MTNHMDIELDVDDVERLLVHLPGGNYLDIQISGKGYVDVKSGALGTTLEVYHDDFAVGLKIVDRKT